MIGRLVNPNEIGLAIQWVIAAGLRTAPRLWRAGEDSFPSLRALAIVKRLLTSGMSHYDVFGP